MNLHSSFIQLFTSLRNTKKLRMKYQKATLNFPFVHICLPFSVGAFWLDGKLIEFPVGLLNVITAILTMLKVGHFSNK